MKVDINQLNHHNSAIHPVKNPHFCWFNEHVPIASSTGTPTSAPSSSALRAVPQHPAACAAEASHFTSYGPKFPWATPSGRPLQRNGNSMEYDGVWWNIVGISMEYSGIFNGT